MKVGLAAAAALAVGLTVCAETTPTFALWQDQATISFTITTGYIHFAVDDPHADPAKMNSIDAAGESVAWTLPVHVLAELAPDAPQTAVAQIDAQSQGNRGLAYRLSGVTVHGDDSLARAADVRITQVAAPALCTVGSANGVELFDDSLLTAQTAARELVTSAYTDEQWTDPETEYLCLELSVPAGIGDYSGTATVTGMADGGLEADASVSASDSWSATGVPSEAARKAVVELTFDYQTYRDGEF